MNKKKKNKSNITRSRSRIWLSIVSVLVLLIFLFIYVFRNKSMFNTDIDKNQPVVTKKSDFKIEGRLAFLNGKKDTITTIAIEIADEDYSREKGMMYRYYVPDTVGMLFVFPQEDYRSFWMKNTPASLDIYYANKNRKIVRMYENTPPHSEASLPSGMPAKYVIEVKAGFAARHGLQKGNTFNYSQFDN